VHRANLHATYAETNGKAVGRDELELDHFANWIEWAKRKGIKLDFNPTYFAHPNAASGYTLSSADPEIQSFWIRHGIVSRNIASGMSLALGGECVINHWIPDGAKDATVDRWGPRKRLIEAYDEILNEALPGCTDAVESKLFGLASEDYVVGSFEFYLSYSLTRKVVLCLDMGHFHPTESVADKLSSILQFQDRVLLHTSRPMRWDSDHVVVYNDELRSVFLELVRGGALEKAIVALDFFDASINRIGAYVVGIRATRKGILNALLEPTSMVQGYEAQGKNAHKLAMLEEFKTLPFGAIWNELCERADVPVGKNWICDMEAYEKKVLVNRT
jgi:L-rhamnose isomerase